MSVSTAIFDSARVPVGWALSNSDKTITNVSAGNSSDAFCPCTFPIARGEYDKVIYWELVTSRSLSGNMDGFVGVVPFAFRGDYDSNRTPVNSDFFPSWGWRGSRAIWRNGSTVINLRSELSYDSKRLRIAWQPSTGYLWCGVGATWQGSNVPPSTPTSTMRAFLGFSTLTLGTIYAQVKGQGDAITILSNTSEFVDGLPSGCVALDDVLEYGPLDDSFLFKTTSYLVQQQTDNPQEGNVRKTALYLVQQPPVILGEGEVQKIVSYVVQQTDNPQESNVRKVASYLVQQEPFLKGLAQLDANKKPTYVTSGSKNFVSFGSGKELDVLVAPYSEMVSFWKAPSGKVWVRRFSGVLGTNITVMKNDFEQATILRYNPGTLFCFESLSRMFEQEELT